MNLLLEDTEREAYESLSDNRPAFLGAPIVTGAILPLTVARLKRVSVPYDSKAFEPQSLTGWTMRAALGGGFASPVAGNWPITFTAADSSTQSSDWIIPYNPTSDDIYNALNALSKVTDIGGVSVQGASGFYEITFNTVGARNLLTGNPTRLVPLSLLNFARAVTGDGSTQEVQTLRILQNVGALVTLGADATFGPTQADLIVGDGSHNAKIRVTLPTTRYGGTWTVTKGATTSGNIGSNDNEAQIQAALQTAFGSGNVLVSQADSDNYDLTFIGTLGLQSITITLDGSALLVPQTMSGELDTTGAGIDLLFTTAQDAIATFEIEGAPSGGNNRKLFQTDLQLRRAIVTAATTAPTGSQTVEDYSGTGADLTPTGTSQTLTLAPAKRFTQWYQLITAASGSGSYTINVVLARANAVPGARYTVEIDLPASANPVFNIRDNSVGGTILDTIPGDSSNAMKYVFEGVYKSGAWAWYRSAIQT